MGIFAGGVMLEKSGYLSVYIFSGGTVIIAALFFLQKGHEIELDTKIVTASPLCLRMVAGYKDRFNSKFVFAIDGIFLYLESYFWMISLFLIVRHELTGSYKNYKNVLFKVMDKNKIIISIGTVTADTSFWFPIGFCFAARRISCIEPVTGPGVIIFDFIHNRKRH
jgi:hypothetical protein